MIAAVDVDYRAGCAVAACVTFETWSQEHVSRSWTRRLEAAADYVPGSFYARELPCLLAVLDGVAGLEAVVVDGFVWLGPDRPGLGAHLYEALGGRCAVVGVAKTSFVGAPAQAVLRGGSARPLWVTAIGLAREEAARRVAAMHGAHRLPTLLRRVDRLCREG